MGFLLRFLLMMMLLRVTKQNPIKYDKETSWKTGAYQPVASKPPETDELEDFEPYSPALVLSFSFILAFLVFFIVGLSLYTLRFHQKKERQKDNLQKLSINSTSFLIRKIEEIQRKNPSKPFPILESQLKELKELDKKIKSKNKQKSNNQSSSVYISSSKSSASFEQVFIDSHVGSYGTNDKKEAKNEMDYLLETNEHNKRAKKHYFRDKKKNRK